MARTPSYADLADVTGDYQDREPASRSIWRGVLTGAAMGIVLVALFMAAYLAAPIVLLPWTFVITAVLLFVLLFFLLRIPYKDAPLVAEPVETAQLSAAAVANQEQVLREEQLRLQKELQRKIETSKEAVASASRTQTPMKWAKAMDELGRAFLEFAVLDKAMMGRRAALAPLKQGGAAFRRALVERTFERMPEDWAVTTLGLAKILLMLGERSSYPAHLEEAIGAFSDSLRVFTEEKNPLEVADVQEGITKAKGLLDEIHEEQLKMDMDGGDFG